MKKLDFILDKIEDILFTLFAAIMAFAILIQVINRNTIQIPFTWGEELARYCMIWLTFIGISAGVKKGSHIGVDAIINALPKNIQKILRIIIDVIVTCIYFYLTVLSIQITLGIRETKQVSPAMQVPMFIIYSALIVGMLFSTLRSIKITAEHISDKTKSESNNIDEYKTGGNVL